MRNHMSNADRAKQFLPFAALKGFEEAIDGAAFTPEARVLLGEDAQEELDRGLRHLRPGDRVRVRCYRESAYETVQGPVRKIDQPRRSLWIGEQEIRFADIVSLTEPDGLN